MTSRGERAMTPLARLAHFIAHHRRAVIVVWVLLTLFGAFSAGQVSKRWFESFSIPGYSAYEANQRTLKTFGTGEQSPLVAVFRSSGDVTKATGIKDAIAAAAKVNPGSRVSSYWSTGSRAYVSKDGHTAFAEIYPPGTPKFSSSVHIDQVRARLKAATPAGVEASLTGRDAIYAASSGGGKGPSILTEALIGGVGWLVILPLPFIRSIGLGGMLIPAVSVVAAITLLPALLATLGTRINSVRLLPKRFVDSGHPEDGWWGRWASLVMRRPVPVAAIGLAIVGALVYCGVQLNPSEAQAKDF